MNRRLRRKGNQMDVVKTTPINEILIRFDATGAVKGAHQVKCEILTDTDTDDVLSEKMCPAEALDPADVETVLGTVATGMLKQIAGLEADVAAKQIEIDTLKAQIPVAA